jgi:hypothetical protein
MCEIEYSEINKHALLKSVLHSDMTVKVGSQPKAINMTPILIVK